MLSWASHTLAALRGTVGLPRMLVAFPGWRDQVGPTLDRIAALAGVDVPHAAMQAVRHNFVSDAVHGGTAAPDGPVTDLCVALHDVLQTCAAQGTVPDSTQLAPFADRLSTLSAPVRTAEDRHARRIWKPARNSPLWMNAAPRWKRTSPPGPATPRRCATRSPAPKPSATRPKRGCARPSSDATAPDERAVAAERQRDAAAAEAARHIAAAQAHRDALQTQLAATEAQRDHLSAILAETNVQRDELAATLPGPICSATTCTSADRPCR